MAIFQHGVDRLMERYPYHKALLDTLRIQPQKSARYIMAVGWEYNRITLWYSQKAIAPLTADEVCLVLCHEMNHIIGRHISMSPREYSDFYAHFIACEVTADEYIKKINNPPWREFPLKDYPMLPPDESARKRYARLEKEERKIRNLEELNNLTQGVIDDHSTWESIQQEAKEWLDEFLDDLQETAWNSLTDQQKTKAVGSLPGKFVETLAMRPATIDWQTLLYNRLGKELELTPAINRPCRRHPELCGVVPGRRRNPGKPRLLVAIDTSGSMSSRELEQIAAEARRLKADFDIYVVEADAKIQKVFRPEEMVDFKEMNGRGGTDFRPALAEPLLQKYQIDLVIYFTDGYGPVPPIPPIVPVIWCITEEGTKPAPWGDFIPLSFSKEG